MTSPWASRDASFSRLFPMLRISLADSLADSSSASLLRFVPRFRALEGLGEVSAASAWTCVCVGSHAADSGWGLTGHCSDLTESSWGKPLQVSLLCSSEAESDSTACEWSLKYGEEAKVSVSSVSRYKMNFKQRRHIKIWRPRLHPDARNNPFDADGNEKNNLAAFWAH